MKLKIDGVEVEVGSAAEAAELLAHLRDHEARQAARAGIGQNRQQSPKTEPKGKTVKKAAGGAESQTVIGRTGLNSAPLLLPVDFGECWKKPEDLGGCQNRTPILASGKSAGVCHEHASQATRDNWKKLEIKHKQSTVFLLPGMTVDALGVSKRRGYSWDPEHLRGDNRIVRPHGRPPKSAYGPKPTEPGELVPTTLSEFKSAQIDWLWHHRIPAGMLTVLYADPGVGKGTMTAAVAAAVTMGSALPMDERQREPGSVLFVVAEDHPNLTLRPRLDAAGADVARVQVFGPELRLRLPEHAANIERAAQQMSARLIVIDPLRGIIDGDSRPKVRKALTALDDIAIRTGAAVLVIHHTNRAGKLHGSQDILGIPRSVLHVDIERDLRRVYPVKKNLAPDVEPVYFKIATVGDVGAIEWVDAAEVEPDVDDESPVDDGDAADQVLAELQLKVERPTLEGGVMWDGAAGAAALGLDDVAKRLEVSPRSLRVRIRRGTAAALLACAAVVEGQRYWTRSAVELLIERGLEVVGKRLPGPPAGTGAVAEEQKLSADFVRDLLVKHAGSVTRAAGAVSMSRPQLRRRVTELELEPFAEKLRQTAGKPRFAPGTPAKERRAAVTARCACCGRGIHQKFEVCVDCTKCRKVDDGSFESAGLCPRVFEKKLRPVTVEQVEAEHRAFVERQQAKKVAGAVGHDRVAHNHRPKTEPF